MPKQDVEVAIDIDRRVLQLLPLPPCSSHDRGSAGQLDRTSALMERAIPGALVTGHEALIDGLVLPDPDDRHVR